MTFTAKATLKYEATSDFKNTDDFLPNENFVYEFDCDDLTATQMFKAYEKFLLVIGHNEQSIMSGACSLAFSDWRSPEMMKKVAKEYDLILSEDANNRILELERENWNLISKVRDLSAKLSRLQDPDNPNYTNEEVEAITEEILNDVNITTLRKAYRVCRDCGDKYGEYKGGVFSTWESTCHVCKKTKPVTEVGNYRYLQKGIQELENETI
jgi:hypothetical protein